MALGYHASSSSRIKQVEIETLDGCVSASVITVEAERVVRFELGPLIIRRANQNARHAVQQL